MPRKTSLKSIEAQIRKLQQRAEQLKQASKAPAIAEILKLMRANDISIADLRDAAKANEKRVPGKRSPAKVKYRNAETGETWSGRGRAPRWLAAAEKAGRQREEFAV